VTGSQSVNINVLGDTGWCGSPAMTPIARQLDRLDGDILLAGDLAYPDGRLSEFKQCFEPDFGRFRPRMRAAPGNHDYVGSVTADGYFSFFGDRAGPNRKGFYAFKAGEWTVLMLNSNVSMTRTGNNEQYNWIQTTLQTNPTRCSMAVLHHPYDSSGINGPSPWQRDMWELMYKLGLDVVVAGHDHLYERHAPMNHELRRDETRGIRLFVVGTGGAPLYNKVRTAANSEWFEQKWGLLRLKLDPALYEWQFLEYNTGNVLDRGLTICH
jgi:3',5'-cyclic AMP phosphodiesterase CpdA